MVVISENTTNACVLGAPGGFPGSTAQPVGAQKLPPGDISSVPGPVPAQGSELLSSSWSGAPSAKDDFRSRSSDTDHPLDTPVSFCCFTGV